MTDQNKKNSLVAWIIGFITGGAVAAPITAFICSKVNDKKVADIQNKAYENGINDMAAYAVSQQQYQNKNVVVEEVTEIPEPPVDWINDMNEPIDDAEATEEAAERTFEHERYLDMIDRYNGNDKIPPYIIDADKFVNEQYMEKSYVNWYEDDNVFEEDLNLIDDPFMTFGVTDGKELFKNAENRRDPDICYVRNENVTTDFEISRIHGSYSKMVGDEGSLGETDT